MADLWVKIQGGCGHRDTQGLHPVLRDALPYLCLVLWCGSFRCACQKRAEVFTYCETRQDCHLISCWWGGDFDFKPLFILFVCCCCCCCCCCYRCVRLVVVGTDEHGRRAHLRDRAVMVR